jgi:hypothetical protein
MKDHLSIEVEQTEDANLVTLTFSPVVVDVDELED